MTKRATTKSSLDGTCYTYTYCDHLSDGWYDQIKGFWKTQKVWCCSGCWSIIKLKKDQTIQEYVIAEHSQF